MSDKRQDFEMDAGMSKDVYFNLLDGDTPLDLTGATLRWRMGPQAGGAATLQKTSPNGVMINGDPKNGNVWLKISDGDIPQSGLYWHNLEVTLAQRSNVVASGRVVVSPAVAAAG
jgi:hypothetical protein